MTEPRPRDLPGLRAKFEDFDKQDVYERVVRRACDPAAQNFVVLFGPDKAKVALDLDTDDFEDLFILKDARCPVRWINFWNTSDHDDAIKIIGDHYGFTRRLRASIVNWDEYRRHNKGHKATVDQKRVREEQLRAQQQPDNTHAEKTDLETGLNGDAIKQAHARAEDVGKNAGPATLDPKVMADFKVVQDALNYTTTDYGARFFCFGANWLHVRPSEGDVPDARLVPPHHWAWYALCSDATTTNTVISIHEAPNYTTPPKGERRDEWEAAERRSMRTNTIAVLEQLSTIGISKHNGNLLLLKAIRESEKADSSMRSLTTVPNDKIADVAASNLFYYLFEDYSAVMAVLHNSRRMLEDIARRVLSGPKKGDNAVTSQVVTELHKLGRDLRQLHHLFTSYKKLFAAVITPPGTDAAETRVVKLEWQALDRFKRLIDRLDLLMLDTIKEYIEEKAELSNTYFNLTAQKDSQATARLTRSATLLAKLSVFFLPISFITSYFSVQIPDLFNSYTGKTYWYTFAVVATVSFLSLFFFSKLLMFVSDWLDEVAETVSRAVGKTLRRGKNHDKEE